METAIRRKMQKKKKEKPKRFFKFIEYLFEYISTQEKENDCRMTYTM